MAKVTIETYIAKIEEKKWEAHNKEWLYIEINAKDLMNEVDPSAKLATTCCKAIYEQLLEGDSILVKPNTKSQMGVTLTVRYYVDNLDPSRKKYDGEIK